MKGSSKIALAAVVGTAALLFKKKRTVSGIGKLGLQSEKNRNKAIKELEDKLLKERVRIDNFRVRNSIWYNDGSECVKLLAYNAGGKTEEADKIGEEMGKDFNAAIRKAYLAMTECCAILEDIKNGDLKNRSRWKQFFKYYKY